MAAEIHELSICNDTALDSISCLTCARRQAVSTRRLPSCDGSRPRCTECTRLHLKCGYNGPPINLEFQDETELVRKQAVASKRRKITAVEGQSGRITEPSPATASADIQENMFLMVSDFDHDWALSFELPDPEFLNWEQDLPEGLVARASSPEQLFAPASTNAAGYDPQEPLDAVITPLHACSRAHTAPESSRTASAGKEKRVAIVEKLAVVPIHILVQQYSSTAVHREKSTNWNFYMHFYHRFATNHPPVLLAIYAFASAQLLYAIELGSMQSAASYYDDSMSKLISLYGINIPEILTPTSKRDFLQSLEKLDSERMDVVLISLYFLALFDLMTTRPVKLRRILRVMPLLIRHRDQTKLSGTFLRLSTWFLYLDTRASLFGVGDDESLIWTIGNESELVGAVHASANVLREEYGMVYPKVESERDQLSLPYLTRILEIMVIFREISRHNSSVNDEMKNRIRRKIDDQSKGLEVSDEEISKKIHLSSYYYAILSLYNAVEIYYSRMFYPNSSLYIASDFAVTILTTTEKMHRKMRLPQAATPHSKAWPIPLILATIEVHDPVRRNWGLRKLDDYRRAGNHYIKTSNFVEQVCEAEEEEGVRVDLGHFMREMDEQFII